MTCDEALAVLGKERPRDNKLSCPSGHQTPGGTPSLHVYDDSFYCFSCGKSGDAYGLIAFYTGKDIKDVLREYGDQNYGGGETVVSTRADMMHSVYAEWQEFNRTYWPALNSAAIGGGVTHLLDAVDRASWIQYELWGGTLSLRHLDDTMTPHHLRDEVMHAMGFMNDVLEWVQELDNLRRGDNDIFGTTVLGEVSLARGSGGGRLRGGVTVRSVGSERVASPEGEHGGHDGRDETQPRLLQRLNVGRGSGVRA